MEQVFINLIFKKLKTNPFTKRTFNYIFSGEKNHPKDPKRGRIINRKCEVPRSFGTCLVKDAILLPRKDISILSSIVNYHVILDFDLLILYNNNNNIFYSSESLKPSSHFRFVHP